MSDYPMPSHACMMWVAGDTLFVRFPPQAGHDTGHVVQFQADEIGLKGLVSVMRARAKHQAQLSVGHKATPTQWDVQRLRAMADAIKTTTVVKVTEKPLTQGQIAFREREAKRARREAELADLIADLEL